MPRIVQEVRINKNAPTPAEVITIDGAPLPFYVAGETLRIDVDPMSGMSTVWLGVMADRVIIESTEAAT